MYKCEKCNKEFSSKHWLNYHLNKAIPCDIEYKCLKCNKVFTTKQGLKRHMNRLYSCDHNLNPHKTSQTLTKIEFKCEYCSQTFTRKDNLTRHINKYCLKKKDILEEIDMLKKENNELKKANETSNTIIFQTNQKINNTNIVNNNTININAFGKEDISYITEDILLKVVRNPEDGIPMLIKHIHFNPEHPNNQNILLKNKKENLVGCFNGNKWEVQDKDMVIQKLIISKKDIADDYYDEVEASQEKIVSSMMTKNYDKYTEYIDKYLNTIILSENKDEYIQKYKRLYDKLYKQINLILLNNIELKKLNELSN